MDPSRLPYELQFRYLSDLSNEEIFSYCRSSRATWEIWLTPAFWDRRAWQNFGVGLIHVEGTSPFHQYQQLERLEREEPVLLLILAITQRAIDQIPRYFRKARLFSFENKLLRYKPLLPMILTQLVEEGSSNLLEVLLKSMVEQIGAERARHLQIVAHEAYLKARQLKRDDLVRLLDRFLVPELSS